LEDWLARQGIEGGALLRGPVRRGSRQAEQQLMISTSACPSRHPGARLDPLGRALAARGTAAASSPTPPQTRSPTGCWRCSTGSVFGRWSRSGGSAGMGRRGLAGTGLRGRIGPRDAVASRGPIGL